MAQNKLYILWAEYKLNFQDQELVNAAIPTLKHFNIDVEKANIPGETLKKIREGNIDLLVYHLSNIGLGQHATDELERIRQYNPDIPILGISGGPVNTPSGTIHTRDIQKIYSLTDILYKPFSPEDFLDKVSEILGIEIPY